MKQFSVKPNVLTGSDVLNIFSQLDYKRVCIITDKFLQESHKVDRVIESLERNSEVFIFSDVKPDPTQEIIDRATDEIEKFSPDLLIAFGGGSSIDSAKAIIYQAQKRSGKRPIFAVIPTTAGTGSEVTNFAVITKGTKKDVLIDDLLLPDYAILDAYFTKSVPEKITVDTGLDVFTHAIEAYLSTNKSIFTDVYAIEAMKTVFESLPSLYKDGLNMTKRAKMLEASCMAGMAFTNAGLGIVHSLAHIVGGVFHISHGRLNAIILPYVLEFYIKRSDEVKKSLDQLAIKLGCENSTYLLKSYKDLAQACDIENSLRQLDKIDLLKYENSISEMAEVALNDRCTKTTPVYITKQDLSNLLRDLIK